MRVTTLPLGVLDTNCYVADAVGQALVVDPGGDPAQVLDLLAAEKLQLATILLTHLHFDHTQGTAALAKATGAKVLANPEDEYLMEFWLGAGGEMGFPETPAFSYEPLSEGRLTLLGQPCDVLRTPGHSLGSLSFHFPEAALIFTGDVLFRRSVGRTDFPGGDAALLKTSISQKIFSLPEETLVYPGHGEPTTVGDEKRNNPFVGPFSNI